jgi:hypothetical protein
MHDEHAPFAVQTQFAFALPCGFVDERGEVHRDGVMRLGTAFDEVQPLSDPRVQANQAYISILLLSRVVTRLGGISPVTPSIIERMFAADFAYLQDLYVHLNESNSVTAETQCPDCGSRFAVDLAGVGR